VTARTSRGARKRQATTSKRILRIFVSHNTDYEGIATQLRLALQALESKFELDVMLCEEMPGSTEWEKWIMESIKDAHLFLLLYPHENVDMTWCTYEKALFVASARPGGSITCIKNPGLQPPKLFDKYQAYDANESGIRNFLFDVFVKGVFTRNIPVNPAVATEGTRFYTRAKEVTQELADHFARARTQAAFFERRIRIDLPETRKPVTSLDAATVDGNAVALDLLDIGAHGRVAWPVLRDAAHERGARWPLDVEAALPRMNAHLMPSPLSPFKAKATIYIPVISRIETVDGHLRSFYIIFVEANDEKLRSMFDDWTPPQAIPEGWPYVIRIMKLMIQARWDILEPAYQQASDRHATNDAIFESGEEALRALRQMSQRWREKRMGGKDKFRFSFEPSVHATIDKLTAEWVSIHGQLEQTVAARSDGIPELLQALLRNNAQWLGLAADQLNYLTKRLEGARSAAKPRRGSPTGTPREADSAAPA